MIEHKKDLPAVRKAVSVFIDNSGWILLFLSILVLFFSFYTEHFFSMKTLVTIANQIPSQLVLATGMTYVLIIAGIDLSIGSVMALCGTILSITLINYGMPVIPALFCTACAGALCGLLNGIVSFRFQIPSFIVTLGMMGIARGAAYLLSDSRTIYIGSRLGLFTRSVPGGISAAFIIAVAIGAAGQFILSYTVAGRYLFGIGMKESDMPLGKRFMAGIKTAVYAIMGLLVSVAAVFHVAKLEASDPNAGSGFELEVIAAVVIGGTSLLGGRGSVVNSMIGVIIIAVLNSGLAQLGVNDPLKQMITGILIIIAVLLDRFRKSSRF